MSPRRGDTPAWSVVWAFAGTAASRLLWLGALAVLARLLSPQDFGLLAFALVYITYVETVADLGTGSALIYWPERRQEAAQVTFVSNALAGLGWCAFTLLIAPWIAEFFHSPSGVPILRALALSFPLKFLGTTHDALCQKEMRFRVRLVPEVAMAAGKAGVAVGLAFAGFGIWSLVWGQLAGLAAWTIALWLVVPWRPSWRWPSRELARPMLAYGRGIVAVNVLAAVTHHADLVIVGRALGARMLGLYQMAYKVPEMTVIVAVWVVSKVLFPAFSRAHAIGEAVGVLYVEALRWISLLTVPASLGLALLAEPLVLTLFGERWREAAPILQVLALYTGLRALGAHAGDVLKATGRPGLLAAIAVAKAVLLVPLLLLAARSGPVAVALTLAGVTALTILFNVAAVCRLTRVTPRALLAALRPSLLAGTGMAAVLLVWRNLAPAAAGPLALPAAVSLGAAAYLLVLRLVSPGLVGEARRALAPHPLSPSPIALPPTGRGETIPNRRSQKEDELAPPAFPLSRGKGVRWERGTGGEELASLDRFIFPAGEPAIASYLHERLLAPHNLRERLRRSVLLSLPSLAPRLLLPVPVSGNGHAPALEVIAAALAIPDLLPSLGDRPARWLLVEDYAGNDREQLVLFLFAAGRVNPAAVLKLRRAGAAGGSLQREAAALRVLAERLPPELRLTVPKVLAWREVSGIEALVMSPLPGVSAYVEMQGLLAPGRAVGRHFAAAATWLARFHSATGATHGDFWARNLLVGPDGNAAVVDWEHFAADKPVQDDLFHFPLTYGLNYPWTRWRRLPPDEAFHRTFLEDNRVSRAVFRYFARYSAATGLDSAALPRLFHAYLETRPGNDLPWDEFRNLLGRAGRSVYSG